MAEKTVKTAEAKAEAKETKAEEYITIRVPKKGKEDALFVGVNFKNYILKRGEYVKIPKAVWEVIQNSELAEEFAESYARAKENAFLEKAEKSL